MYLKHTDPIVKRICDSIGYTGQKISMKEEADKVSMYGTYWDGGSRNAYHCLRLDTFASVPLPHFNPPQFGGPIEDPVIPMIEGMIVVQESEGYRPSILIYVHPNNVTKLLPMANGPEMPWEEKTVLIFTASLKSSYAGIKNYRYHEAHRESGITLAEWEAAKVSLIAKGYLNKAGAITVDGRNAESLIKGNRYSWKRPVPVTTEGAIVTV